jgi:hypothetical protein
MPKAPLKLPTGEEIEVISVVGHGGTVSSYYNGIRRGWINEQSNIAQQYRLLVPELVKNLIAGVEESGIEFDAVLIPPSSRPDAVPFKNAITTRWPTARDITSTFDRSGVTKAADPHGSEIMVNELMHAPDGKENDIKSLLIVDESVAEGKTAAAIVHHLRAAGMPKETKVTLAVCCRMK